MITLEEIVSRLGDTLPDFSKTTTGNNVDTVWHPETITNYTVPVFSIPTSKAKGSKKKREAQLSKVLAFIDRVKHLRATTGCTIMPISTRSKALIGIWGSVKNVSRAIIFMKNIGLISDENDSYRFYAFRDDENRSRIFRYYKENEDKLIEYCKNNGIDKYTVLNYKAFDSINTIQDVQVEDVIISSDLKLVRPNGYSISQFEDYLLQCLYHNYPELALHQKMADDINQGYYKDYPEFQIRFVPNFTWSNDNKKVIRIGIRATNALVSVKKEKRASLKKTYGFSAEKDIKSSVPRLTLSLNKGAWVDETIDIYELIYKEMGNEGSFTNEAREAIKKLHMSAYFDNGTEKQIGAHVWLKMDRNGVVQSDVLNAISLLKEALVRAEGGKLYGSEIFLVESCIYMDTLYDLLKAGYFVWELYDCFYSNAKDSKAFEMLVQERIKNNFLEYYEKYFKKRR